MRWSRFDPDKRLQIALSRSGSQKQELNISTKVIDEKWFILSSQEKPKVMKEFTFSKEESWTDNPFDKSVLKSELDMRFESEFEDDPPEWPVKGNGDEAESLEIDDDELAVNVTNRFSNKQLDHFSRNAAKTMSLSAKGPHKSIIVRKEVVKQIYDDEFEVEIECPAWVPPKIETYLAKLSNGTLKQNENKKDIERIEVFI